MLPIALLSLLFISSCGGGGGGGTASGDEQSRDDLQTPDPPEALVSAFYADLDLWSADGYQLLGFMVDVATGDFIATEFQTGNVLEPQLRGAIFRVGGLGGALRLNDNMLPERVSFEAGGWLEFSNYSGGSVELALYGSDATLAFREVVEFSLDQAPNPRDQEIVPTTALMPLSDFGGTVFIASRERADQIKTVTRYIQVAGCVGYGVITVKTGGAAAAAAPTVAAMCTSAAMGLWAEYRGSEESSVVASGIDFALCVHGDAFSCLGIQADLWLLSNSLYARDYAKTTIEVKGTGAGEVRSNWGGLRCSSKDSPCTLLFDKSASVELGSIPSRDSRFVGWDGGCVGSATNCTLRTNQDQTVGATFDFDPWASIATMTVAKSGSGAGTIRSSPAGVDCGQYCSATVKKGTTWSISAIPSSGSIFKGWTGLCSGTASCTVVLNDSGNLNAEFSAIGPPADPIVPGRRGGLNDTGITFCRAEPNGNQACVGTEVWGQDAHYGRDADASRGELTKVGAGKAGFDFTKISNSGSAIGPSVQLGASSGDWGCTRDNVTGLIWEVKVDDPSHLRHRGHVYTWYEPGSPDGNPGARSPICNTFACDTTAYVDAVNAQRLCGATDWRMPTARELQGIVDYAERGLGVVRTGYYGPAIDPQYFPNTVSGQYWSRVPSARFTDQAWTIGFSQGFSERAARTTPLHVRLVRDGDVR